MERLAAHLFARHRFRPRAPQPATDAAHPALGERRGSLPEHRLPFSPVWGRYSPF
jgi:hypothetical protein